MSCSSSKKRERLEDFLKTWVSRYGFEDYRPSKFVYKSKIARMINLSKTNFPQEISIFFKILLIDE